MSIVIVNKVTEAEKPAKADTNTLGISRGIYAAGYSVRDSIIWGVGSAAAIFAAVTVGVKYKIGFIEKFAEKLNRMHGWWKNKTGEMIKGPILAVSLAAGYLVAHIAPIPSAAFGWRKAQDAIDQHNELLKERDRLIETTSQIAEENEKLKITVGKLQAQETRPSLAERVRVQAAENAVSNGLQ